MLVLSKDSSAAPQSAAEPADELISLRSRKPPHSRDGAEEEQDEKEVSPVHRRSPQLTGNKRARESAENSSDDNAANGDNPTLQNDSPTMNGVSAMSVDSDGRSVKRRQTSSPSIKEEPGEEPGEASSPSPSQDSPPASPESTAKAKSKVAAEATTKKPVGKRAVRRRGGGRRPNDLSTWPPVQNLSIRDLPIPRLMPLPNEEKDDGHTKRNGDRKAGHSRAPRGGTQSVRLCGLCRKEFATKEERKAHLATHKYDKTFPCPECKREFKEQSLLHAHLLHCAHMRHTSQLRFICRYCYAKFGLKVDLAVHMLRKHICPHCEHTFANPQNLRSHIIADRCMPKYACPKCDKVLKWPVSYETHLRTHMGEKPYLCKTCNKRFSDRSNYNRHLRLHTGVTPHKCPHCDKTFTRKDHLTVHLRVHTGEKPYKCTECDKAFSQTQHLRGHIRRVHKKF